MGYNTPIAFGGGPSIDAFSRARESEPARAQRALGTLTVTAQGVGGTSTNCRAVLNWLEVR